MARKFRELEVGMSPQAIRTSDAVYHRLKEAMALEARVPKLPVVPPSSH